MLQPFYLGFKTNNKLTTYKIKLTTKKGPVVQLNRTSDSGSESHGFEPHPGHKEKTSRNH